MLTSDRADFCCHECNSDDIYRVNGYDGTFECADCGYQTHQKIERSRDDLAELAEYDVPAARLAELLTDGDSA